ncbi:MAG: DUF2007 domain-containing protein [Bacteroidota bacterium]|nr:DUF2007 domain-containing protein [Bacteroidota bacterium]
MEKKEELVRVFTGSQVQAEFVKVMLEDNDIGALIRNTMRESLTAGWVSGSQEDACRVYVARSHQSEADILVEQYLETEGFTEE